jgi:hypothetical protein
MLDVGPVHLENLVRGQPFVDVRVESVKMPHGLWPEGTLLEKFSDTSDLRGKTIGWYSLGVYGKGVESLAPNMEKIFPDLTYDERNSLITQVKADLSNRNFHSYTLL